MSDLKPNYIYKLVSYKTPPPSTVASELPEALPISEIDKSSGFVHLSTARQVPNTLKFFFGGDPLVYILRIKYDDVEKDIKWEDPKAEVCGPRGGEGMFPHLYNGFKLGKDEVDDILVVERGDGEWEAAIQEVQGWMIY
ncbi:hypothetical protein HYDPIDRAFT_112442 [Hydnomerulius pinastri MD-312]|uniref:DUF952 domain-containing protein n=1 Tax=Hydnomerulius pinastri MD-312 TaxID=994086 RepID=A0A0C9VEG5_9AGAM|nr:hypothetical protein HYDPIDRAFT_112442 [Hydnomerulius pinastri MD-312]